MPFREWDLPVAIVRVRERILKQQKGDCAFVELLMLAREFDLEPLQVACELVLDGNVVTAAVVMNEMRHLVAPSTPIPLLLPDMLKLQTERRADCDRYDHLRAGSGDGLSGGGVRCTARPPASPGHTSIDVSAG